MQAPVIIARNRKHLEKLIEYELEMHGQGCNLNHIDVSGISDFSYLFSHTTFCGNVSDWNVANAIFMQGMFYGCRDFNCDISGWDVSHVENMKEMFCSCHAFNQDLSRWSVRCVQQMSYMFCASGFANDVSTWAVSPNTLTQHMFGQKGLLVQSMSSWVVEIYLAERIQHEDETWRQAFLDVGSFATTLGLSTREQAICIMEKYRQLMGMSPTFDTMDDNVFSTLQT